MITFLINNEMIELPPHNGFSLMEVLRAAGHTIPAVCGGMALCATCLVQINQGSESLPAPGDMEQDMLDTLPLSAGHYRLSCQLRADETLNGSIIQIPK